MSIKIFTPDVYVRRVTDIPISFFDSIKVIFTDADNTLSAHDSQTPVDGIKEWISELQDKNINVILLSNNSKERCEPFAKSLKMDYISDAGKPMSKKLLAKVKELKVDKKDCIVIGDQFYTDLLCAKNAGIRFILVDPLFNDTKGFIKIKRFFEKPLRKCLQYTKV